MLQVARLAPNLLAEAAPLVTEFLIGELSEDGGAQDRAGKSDLYYTAFLLDALIALRTDLPVERVRSYLEGFGAGADLDLVHQACLVRAWTALDVGWPTADFPGAVLDTFETRRAADGGYAKEPGVSDGTLYDAFLALGVYQDLGVQLPDPVALGESLERLRTDDGAYANALDLPLGTTPSTAAAAAVLAQLELPVPDEVGPWLLAQQHPKGGFLAMPDAPMPDLLSTATALHALAALRMPLGGPDQRAQGDEAGVRKELALDFLDSLWSGRSFYGHWADDALDCEYAFYALLALGHLAV